MIEKTVKVTCKIKGKMQTANPALPFTVYGDIEEAVDGLGDVVCLALINKQSQTDKMNACREAYRDIHDPKMTKAGLRNKAIAAIPTDELVAAIAVLKEGDPSKFEALIAANVAILQAEAAA